MKLVIFGSTGMTGLCSVEAAVKKGLSVRAFVRDPAKIPEHLKDKVEIFKGDVLDPDSVKDGVKGTDGVVIAIGPPGGSLDPTTMMSEGTKNIIEAMRVHNVTKVSACLSVFLFWNRDRIATRFRDLNEDHERMWMALKESPLNYIAVFAPHIIDTPSSEMDITVNPNDSPGITISKWDLGSYLVDSLNEPKYYRTVIGIANKGTGLNWKEIDHEFDG